MTVTSWEQLINDGQYNQINSGAALTNSVALTDITAGGNVAGEALLLPASYLYPGLQLRVRARGIASTTGTPNLTLGVYFGGVAGSALAVVTFAASSSVTNQSWRMDTDIRVDGAGTAATIRSQGEIIGLNASPVMVPTTTSTGGSVSIASGNSGILTVGAQWGTAAAANSIQLYQFMVEQLN